MNVRELKQLLNECPDEAHIVVNGDVVTGIEVVPGRTRRGYYNVGFFSADKGREKAVIFTRCAEMSDGSVIDNMRI